MYWNCFLTRLWRHKFWNSPYLSIQAVFRYDQKFKTKIELSWEREELLRWNKKHFSSFLKDFQLPKIVSDLRVHLVILDNLKWEICSLKNHIENVLTKCPRSLYFWITMLKFYTVWLYFDWMLKLIYWNIYWKNILKLSRWTLDFMP